MPQKRITRPRNPHLELQDYPMAIAQVRTEMLKLDREIAQYEEAIALIEMKIDAKVGFAPDLKNPEMRRAKRSELRFNSPDLTLAKDKLRVAGEERAKLDIKLGLLRDAFRVSKLQMQWEIAIASDDPNLAFVA